MGINAEFNRLTKAMSIFLIAGQRTDNFIFKSQFAVLRKRCRIDPERAKAPLWLNKNQERVWNRRCFRRCGLAPLS
jgi:hypothetical protein